MVCSSLTVKLSRKTKCYLKDIVAMYQLFWLLFRMTSWLFINNFLDHLMDTFQSYLISSNFRITVALILFLTQFKIAYLYYLQGKHVWSWHIWRYCFVDQGCKHFLATFLLCNIMTVDFWLLCNASIHLRGKYLRSYRKIVSICIMLFGPACQI